MPRLVAEGQKKRVTLRSLADECSFPGNDLLSRKLALEVPSVLKGLTAGFEMGPGVTPSLKSPRKLVLNVVKLAGQTLERSPGNGSIKTLTTE